MAAEGNYITEEDVDNWDDDASEDDRQAVIDRVEELVQEGCKDYFYAKTFDQYLDGNSKNRLYLGLRGVVLSITSITVSGVTLNSDYYTNDEHFVYLDTSSASSEPELRWLLRRGQDSIFPEGLGNIRIQGTHGWSSCPAAVKEACVILAKYENDNSLSTPYSQGAERLGDYSYSSREKPITGIREADRWLRNYVRKQVKLSVV